MTKSRYFFALWPDNGTRECLLNVSRVLPDDCGRKVKPENFHITLVFLGNVEDSLITRLCDEITTVDIGPFSINLDHCGWWRRSRVIYLSPSDVCPDLNKLVRELIQITLSYQIKIDSRKYHPHLTLARKAGSPLEEFSFQPILWPIRSFCLIKSHTYASGAEYEVMHRWSLS